MEKIESLLTFIAPQTELCVKKISEDEFVQLTSIGISEEECNDFLSDLQNETIFIAPVNDVHMQRISLLVNNELINDFQKYFDKIYKALKKNDKLESADQNDESYFVVWDRYYKRTFWNLNITEDFDLKKFSIQPVIENLSDGTKYLGFFPYYNNEMFDFAEDSGFDVDSIFVIDSNKIRHSIEIKE